MLKSINYETTHRYFYPQMTPGIAAILALTIGALVGILIGNMFSAPEVGFIIGIITFVITFGVLMYKEAKSKPRYHDIEEMLKKAKEEVLEQAIEELGLDADSVNVAKPIALEYKVYENCFSAYAYNEEDSMPSNYGFLVILFSENQMYFYKYIFSLISNSQYDTNTGEYFYRDIVAFNTKSKKVTVSVNQGTRTLYCTEFSVTTSGGAAFETYINKEDEKKVQGMRQLLREKKNTKV